MAPYITAFLLAQAVQDFYPGDNGPLVLTSTAEKISISKGGVGYIWDHIVGWQTPKKRLIKEV